MAAKTIEIKILGDNKGLRNALDDSESQVGKWAKNFGKIVAGAGLAAAAGIGVGLAASVKQAVNLGESINAVEVTFGDAAAGIKKLGEEAAQAVGLSNAEFNGLAVQFSSFAKTVAGPGGDVVQTMDDLTTRASDFASVMNLDVSEAAAVFQSGLAGETEPLKKFGIDLSAAAVEAYALANGITDGTGAMTEAQKVQARYGLLMEATAVTQGDFANTSDSLANRQRVLAATVKDLAAKIGSSLLPMLTVIATVIADKLVPWLEQRLPAAIASVSGAIGQAVAVFRGLYDAAASVVGFFAENQYILAGVATLVGGALVAALAAWTVATYAQVTALWLQAGAFLAAHAPIIAIIAVIAALVAGVVYAYQNFETFRTIVDAVVAWLRDVAWPAIQAVAAGIAAAFGELVGFVQLHWDTIRAIIEGVITVVRTVIETALAAIKAIWRAVGDEIVAYVKNTFDTIKAVVQAAIDVVRTVIETALAAIKAIWRAVGDEIVAYVKNTFDTIKAVVQAAIDVVRGIIQTVTALIRGDWSAAWDGIKLIFSGVWDAIKAILSGAIDAMKILLSAAWDAIKLTVEMAWSLIKGVFFLAWETIKATVSAGIGAVVGFMTGLPGKILDAVGDLSTLLYNAGRELIQGFINGIKSMIGAVQDTLGAVTSKLTSWKGPESLDKVILVEYGHLVMEGFLRGLRDRESQIRGYLGGLTNSLSTTITPAVGVAPEIMQSGGGSFSDTTTSATPSVGFQVNGNVVLDGVTTEQVAQRMLFALRAA